MTPAEIIAIKRDGATHTRDQISKLVYGAVHGEFDHTQIAAWLMAAFLNGLDGNETAWLTQEMANSGERVNLEGLPKPWVDKHSTGGVGDKTTIVVLPILAACGLSIVKMSGAGLGITGGTVDKLLSVPGFRVDLTPQQMVEQARTIGIALSAQTPSLAPADGIFYKLRGVTSTVDSVPLIVSSILSKKIAGGADTVILDVKCGSGAFMPTLDKATALASELIRVGTLCDLHVRCAITDMDQPLGESAGNLIEVQEALRTLKGHGDPRFTELCLQLAGLALTAAGRAKTQEAGVLIAREAIASERAIKNCRDWFLAQGVEPGDWDGIESPALLAPIQEVIHYAGKSGYVSRVDANSVGWAVLELGGGRLSKDSQLDRTVGIETHVHIGDFIEPGDALFTLHTGHDKDLLKRAIVRLERAVEVCETPVNSGPVVLKLC